MSKRPSLQQALSVLNAFKDSSADVQQAIDDYEHMINNGHNFRAARYVVDIVDSYYKAAA